MRISDWSSDVCSSDLLPHMEARASGAIINIGALGGVRWTGYAYCAYAASKGAVNSFTQSVALQYAAKGIRANCILPGVMDTPHIYQQISRSEEHTSELQSLMRISYAVFCLKKK